MKQMFLSPVFCLHNGVVILDQHQCGISFGIVNIDDNVLCRRLEKTFYRFIKANGFDMQKSAVHFVKIDKEMCARNVSKLFATDSRAVFPCAAQSGEFHHDENSTRNKAVDSGKEEAPMVALLDSLINDALMAGATDIHIEGQAVRFRICGKLTEHIVFKTETAQSLVLRIKNLAKLNTLEKRRPQDGQFVFPKSTGNVSVRVSSVPSLSGESVALRLLDPARVPLDPSKLGFAKKELADIYSLLRNNDGLILVCGSTGSGKSTTLASLLSALHEKNGGSKKIITIEDPVEYVLKGITQVQINTTIELDFDEMLRRIFRQDPDVIMLGEIRDKKTAAVAVSAALTGHLVFASLHTLGKNETLIRLNDLGIEKELVNAVLRGVISQKLTEKKGALKLQAEVTVMRRHISV
jgi:type II secretory ATPase GspE/PulE/Tfp pilus assembly ATPase PilB-like protein